MDYGEFVRMLLRRWIENFTRFWRLYEEDFDVSCIFCFCERFLKYTSISQHIGRFLKGSFENHPWKLKAGHFVEQVCHPLQWLGVKYSLSCGFLQFPIFDIFVDLGLSRCTLPALLRSPASQCEANIYKSFQPFSDLRSFHSVSICVEIQQRFYNHSCDKGSSCHLLIHSFLLYMPLLKW